MADYTVQMPDGKLKKYVDVSNGAGTAYAEAQALVAANGNKPAVSAAGAFSTGIDQTTPGVTNYFEGKTNVRRNAGVLHRSAAAAVDKLAVPAALAGASNGVGTGSLLHGAAYIWTIAAANRYGATTVPATATLTTAAGADTYSIRLTVPQTPNAESYNIFLSTDAAPKWVGAISETQRAAGCTITAVGTVSATTPGAGLVDVLVAGTQVASTAVPFTTNNAYTPALVTPVVCTGYGVALVNVRVNVTDLRSAPSLSLIMFWQNQISSDWHLVTTNTPSLLTALLKPLAFEFGVNIFGATGLAVLVDAIGGQGTSADIYVDLA